MLRDSADELITILEVVIYDPLYKWSLSPTEAMHRQRYRDVDGTQAGAGGALGHEGSAGRSAGRDVASSRNGREGGAAGDEV